MKLGVLLMSQIKFDALIIQILKMVIGITLSFPCYAVSGKYLEANFALTINDFEKAASNYVALLKTGTSDTKLAHDALVFSIISENSDSTKMVKKIIEKKKLEIPALNLFAMAETIRMKKFDDIQLRLNESGDTYPEFITTFFRGWSFIATNKFDSGIKEFLSFNEGLESIVAYNCALAYAMRGDFSTATTYLGKIDNEKIKLNDRQFLGQLQIYSSAGKNEIAIRLIERRTQNRNAELYKRELKDLIKGNVLKFETYQKFEDVFADVFYLMGTFGDVETNRILASIFYIQLAKYVAIDDNYFNIRLAQIFTEIQSYLLAENEYKKVTLESSFFLKAQLAIADILVELDQQDQAIKKLDVLLQKGFRDFTVYDAIANIYRVKEEYDKAIEYYSSAIEMIPDKDMHKSWATFFLRGIAYDRSGDWRQAKADFDIALQLFPNHPEVLNYLGYSLIERNENLSQALVMIETAIKQKPDSGYIVDSLGWGLFRLGKYAESIIHMQRAIELEPNDPIVNDHFGDVLWMVGRKREARFQWKRALLFGPTSEDEKKIKKKLKLGITDL